MSNIETIQNIKAESIFDSRGNPTLRVTVSTQNFSGTFDVPSGASVGLHEAHELRDEDGKGVSKAISIIEGEVLDCLKDLDICDQKKIDQAMIDLDGTPNKSKIGGNSTIGISVAALRAAAKSKGLETFEYLRSISDVDQGFKSPKLFINLINGGKHAKGGSPFQEHQVIVDTDNVGEAIEISKQIQDNLRNKLEINKTEFDIGDEGGFVFKVTNTLEAFEMMNTSIHELSLENKVYLSSDIAASSFYKDNKYYLLEEEYSADELINLYRDVNQKFNLRFIEDPFFEEEFENFSKLKKEVRGLEVVGDDLTTTNVERIKQAIEKESIGAVIIKVNQIGTISETIDSIKLATENNIKCVISHRSGETMDDFIADLTRAYNCFGMKSGAWGKPEREVKYNRLIDIYK